MQTAKQVIDLQSKQQKVLPKVNAANGVNGA